MTVDNVGERDAVMAKKNDDERRHVRSEGSRYGEMAALPWPTCPDLRLTAHRTTLDVASLPRADLLGGIKDAPLLSAPPDANVVMERRLPAEFATRELFALDPDDDEALLSFMGEHGVVVAPYFDSQAAFSATMRPTERNPEWIRGKRPLEAHLEHAWLSILDECSLSFPNAPDGFRALLRDAAWASEAMRSEAAQRGGELQCAASWQEAKLSLLLLRECVALMAALDVAQGDLRRAFAAMLGFGVVPDLIVGRHQGEEWRGKNAGELLAVGKAEFSEAVESAVLTFESQRSVANAYIFLSGMAFCSGVAYTGFRAFLGDARFEFGAGSSMREAESALDILTRCSPRFGSLGSALALQLVEIVETDLPWRKCEACGRYFKRYRRPGGGVGSQRVKRALLCSSICQRNRKRAGEAAAVRELDRRVSESKGAVSGRSAREVSEWLDDVIDVLNHEDAFLSAYDLKRRRSMPPDERPPLRYPAITAEQKERALKRHFPTLHCLDSCGGSQLPST